MQFDGHGIVLRSKYAMPIVSVTNVVATTHIMFMTTPALACNNIVSLFTIKYTDFNRTVELPVSETSNVIKMSR